jgi:hypothetical protein
MYRGSVPDDVLLGPGAALAELPGLSASQMTAAQRARLAALVDAAATLLPPELHIATGIDALSFTWAGARTPDQPHYFRISAPAFVYEYDNTQEGANHVHTVWHARSSGGGDFGVDLLREHYRVEHRGAR